MCDWVVSNRWFYAETNLKTEKKKKKKTDVITLITLYI